MYLGDTILSAYASETDVSIKGLKISIPLSTRRNMSVAHRGYQIKATDRWDFPFATSSFNGTNQIFMNMAYRPSYLNTLKNDYFSYDRLSLAYIKRNLPRLRDAYTTFVLNPAR